VVTVRNFVKMDPLIIDADESVLEAAKAMKDKGVGNVLVSVKGELKGIVTERDILNRVAADNLLPSSVLVRKIMTSPMISITADTPLTEAVKLAKTVAAQAPVAVQLAKDAVNAAFETTLEQGLEIESKNFFLLFATEDMREGMQAFIEKRKAEFKGK
jgi:CBS domain-containing protein